MAASYIPDGYEEKAYIEGVPGLHGPLRFSYRPMRVEEGSEFYHGLNGLKPREAERHTAKMLASKIRTWSLRGRDDDALKVESKTVLGMQRRLFQRLLAIVIGSEPSDLDPEWSDDEQDAYVSGKVQASTDGKTVQQVKQEADEKNC